MVADPFRRSNGDWASPSCLAVFSATCVGIVVLTFAGCAKDVRQRPDRVAELQLPIPYHTGDAPRPLLVRRASVSETRQAPPKETNRNEPLGNTSKPRPPLATSAPPSPRSRSPEKSNVGPFTPAQKERLFEQFLQWQKRTAVQEMLAMADGTNEPLGATSRASLPLATSASPVPRPRGSEKSKTGLPSPAQTERLFEGFLQWQKTTTIQGILAATDDTNERYAVVGDMR
jgi:hypothetical protein